MGIFNRKKSGWNCKDSEEGVKVCSRVEVDDNNQVLATGTTVGITMDENCSPIITGDSMLMDDDVSEIDKIAKRMSLGCSRGINK